MIRKIWCFLKTMFTGHSIRVVFINPQCEIEGWPRKTYTLGDGKKVEGRQSRDYMDKNLIYPVRRGIARIAVSTFNGLDMPFTVLEDGYLSPAWDCRGKGKALDFMFWVPENYRE